MNVPAARKAEGALVQRSITSRSLEAMGIPPALFELAKAQVAEARRAGRGQVKARRRLADVIAAAGDRDTMQASSAELPVIDMQSL